MQKFGSHAVVRPFRNTVPIKTERSIERQLCVKNELNSPNQNLSASHAQKPANVLKANNWPEEKQELIDKILSLKIENNQHVLALKKMQADYATLLHDKQALEQKIGDNEVQCFIKIKDLQGELSVMKEEFAVKKASDGKTIVDLTREKQMLSARLKQIQTGIEQRNLVENKKEHCDEDDDVFEVESIIGHKQTKTGRKYLIRWKGYDSNEDSWQAESDLKCPIILSRYKNSHKLN